MGKDLNGRGMTIEEQAIFSQQFDFLFGAPTSVIGQINQSVKEFVQGTIEYVMSKESATFGGMYAQSGQIGFGPLRPEHMKWSATAATNYWQRTVTAAWGNLQGSSTAKITQSEYLYPLIWGAQYFGYTRPLVEEIKFVIAEREYVPVRLNGLLVPDNVNSVPVQQIPLMLIESKQDYYIRCFARTAGESYLGFLGCGIGKADTMISESPT